jgi:hypothetical protein
VVHSVSRTQRRETFHVSPARRSSNANGIRKQRRPTALQSVTLNIFGVAATAATCQSDFGV